MPNLPNRNEQGCPGVVYRIDSRPPEIVFQEGFRPWGTSRDIFRHILGYSLGNTLPENERSGFISTSDSPDSSLRFFGSMLHTPGAQSTFYLYEIRADENVYSVLRTVNYYQEMINAGLVDFLSYDANTMTAAIQAIHTVFASQREWVNVGAIPRERIRSAFTVTTVPIDPNHIRHQVLRVYATPMIHDDETLNPHYTEAETYANELAYVDTAEIAESLTLSLPDFALDMLDESGAAASLGFVCPTSDVDDSERSARSVREVSSQGDYNLNGFNYCYFKNKNIVGDKSKIVLEKKNITNLGQLEKPVVLRRVFDSKMFMKTSKRYHDFYLGYGSRSTYKSACLAPSDKPYYGEQFIYDDYQRITFENSKLVYPMALTIVPSTQPDIMVATFEIASINYDNQRFYYEFVKKDANNSYYRIVSRNYKDFSLAKHMNTNDLYFYNKNKIPSSLFYEEVYLVIANNKCDACILLPQKPKSQLVDIGLSWYYNGKNFVPEPHKNVSYESEMLRQKFFYDLTTYRILYLKGDGNVYSLYNNRQTEIHGLVRWIDTTLDKESVSIREKWTMHNKNRNVAPGLNTKIFTSFYLNDYLKVYSYGGNSVLATSQLQDINGAIINFRVSRSVFN